MFLVWMQKVFCFPSLQGNTRLSVKPSSKTRLMRQLVLEEKRLYEQGDNERIDAIQKFIEYLSLLPDGPGYVIINTSNESFADQIAHTLTGIYGPQSVLSPNIDDTVIKEILQSDSAGLPVDKNRQPSAYNFKDIVYTEDVNSGLSTNIGSIFSSSNEFNIDSIKQTANLPNHRRTSSHKINNNINKDISTTVGYDRNNADNLTPSHYSDIYDPIIQLLHFNETIFPNESSYISPFNNANKIKLYDYLKTEKQPYVVNTTLSSVNLPTSASMKDSFSNVLRNIPFNSLLQGPVHNIKNLGNINNGSLLIQNQQNRLPFYLPSFTNQDQHKPTQPENLNPREENYEIKNEKRKIPPASNHVRRPQNGWHNSLRPFRVPLSEALSSEYYPHILDRENLPDVIKELESLFKEVNEETLNADQDNSKPELKVYDSTNSASKHPHGPYIKQNTRDILYALQEEGTKPSQYQHDPYWQDEEFGKQNTSLNRLNNDARKTSISSDFFNLKNKTDEKSILSLTNAERHLLKHEISQAQLSNLHSYKHVTDTVNTEKMQMVMESILSSPTIVHFMMLLATYAAYTAIALDRMSYYHQTPVLSLQNILNEFPHKMQMYNHD